MTPLLVAIAIGIGVSGVFAARWLDRRIGIPLAGPLILIAMTPLVPFIGLGMGVSLDDILPVVGFAMAMLTIVRFRPLADRVPRWILWVGGLALALIVIAAAISSVANGSGLVSARLFLRGAGHMVLVFGIMAVTAIAIQHRGRLKLVLSTALAAVGTFEAVFGLVAYLVPLPGQMGLQPMGRRSALFGEIPGRITGTTGIASNYTGALLLLTILITAGIAMSASSRRARIGAWVAVMVQLVALALTFSRAPLALALAGLVVLVLLRSRPLVLVPVGLAVAVLAVVTPLMDRFVSDTTNRLALWLSAFLIMVDRPLTGTGSGLSRVFARANPDRYVNTELGRAPATAHNAILHGGAELGVLGAIGFLLTYGWLLAIGTFALLHALRRQDTLLLASTLALAGFLIHGMVNNLMTVGMTSVMGFLVAGLVASGILPPIATGHSTDAQAALEDAMPPAVHSPT